MQIVRELAGYSFGRADIVRKAMGKKQMDVMTREREYFINGKKDDNGNVEIKGCVANGVPAEVANEIFDEMVKFAEYAFNKSHAAAYAYVTYYTAFLKTHYKHEYMAALLTSVMDKTDKLVPYIYDCSVQKIKILPPDINCSEEKFTVEGDCIRFALAALKNVGLGVVENIHKEREENGPFKSFYNFCERMLTSYELDSRTVEGLIYAGAFDSFGQNRQQLLSAYPTIKKELAVEIKSKGEGQFSLFGEEEEIEYNYPEIPEFEEKKKLALEKSIIGIYMSGHPLQEYVDLISKSGYPTISDVKGDPDEYSNNTNVSLIGIFSKVTKKITRNDTMMAIIQLQDLTGSIELLLFSRTYDKYAHLLEEDSIVRVSGKISIKEGSFRSQAEQEEGQEEEPAEATIICNDLSIISANAEESLPETEFLPPKEERLLITFTQKDQDKLESCVQILREHQGSSEVYFRFTDIGKQARFNVNNVRISAQLVDNLSAVLGGGKVFVRSV